MGKLDGKVAMITGAARGHAEAIALTVRSRGCRGFLMRCDPVNNLGGESWLKDKSRWWTSSLLPDRRFRRGAGKPDGAGNYCNLGYRSISSPTLLALPGPPKMSGT